MTPVAWGLAIYFGIALAVFVVLARTPRWRPYGGPMDAAMLALVWVLVVIWALVALLATLFAAAIWKEHE